MFLRSRSNAYIRMVEIIYIHIHTCYNYKTTESIMKKVYKIKSYKRIMYLNNYLILYMLYTFTHTHSEEYMYTLFYISIFVILFYKHI